MIEKMTVTDPRVAAAFSKARPRAIILALIAAERSLGELHHLLGLSLSLLHYHLQRLLRLGLVRQVGSRSRAGRPIVLYRAVAESFEVHASLVERGPGAELRAELRASLDHAELACDRASTIYFLDENGRPKMRRVLASAETSFSGEYWWRLSLDDREARELNDQVRALIASYTGRGSGSRRELLCIFALARS